MPGSEITTRRGARSAGLDLRVFLILFALLGAGRLFLPRWVLARVNQVLGTVPGYEARIADVDVNLWRGAYRVEGLSLIPRSRGTPHPRIEVGRLDLSVHWAALLRGGIVAEVVLDDAHVEYVAPPPGDVEPRAEIELADRLAALVPFRIDRFVVSDGELRFRAPDADPPVDLYMTDVALEALDLSNVRPGGAPDDPERDASLFATIEAAGRPFESGEFEARMRLDPLASPPRFELEAELRGVELIALNDFLLAYGSIDAEAGTFEAYAEFASADGEIEGYVKTLFEGLDVLDLEEIDGPGEALEALWEGLVGVAAEVLENQPHDRLATRIPVAGTLDDVETDLVTIVLQLLRNAFIVALRPALDDVIELRGLAIVHRDEADGAAPDDGAARGGEMR